MSLSLNPFDCAIFNFALCTVRFLTSPFQSLPYLHSWRPSKFAHLLLHNLPPLPFFVTSYIYKHITSAIRILLHFLCVWMYSVLQNKCNRKQTHTHTHIHPPIFTQFVCNTKYIPTNNKSKNSLVTFVKCRHVFGITKRLSQAKTSQAITPYHFFDFSNLSHFFSLDNSFLTW